MAEEGVEEGEEAVSATTTVAASGRAAVVTTTPAAPRILLRRLASQRVTGRQAGTLDRMCNSRLVRKHSALVVVGVGTILGSRTWCEDLLALLDDSEALGLDLDVLDTISCLKMPRTWPR